MSRTVKAKPNQSMLDMILMEYGSLEAGMQAMAANSKDISNIPETGSKRLMPAVEASIIDRSGVSYLRQKKIVIGTLALPILEMTVMLKPVMQVVPNVVGDPHTLGYYSYDFKAEPGFINVNPLQDFYLSGNLVNCQTEERWIMGLPFGNETELTATPMAAKSIPYNIHWTEGFGYMMIWGDLSHPVVTATFKDIEDNEAYAAPVVLLDNFSQDMIEYLMADLNVELISATPSSAIVRVTRNHPPVFLADFRDTTMEWLEAAADGTPDPLEPGNPDKIILTLGAGSHTIGVKTTYRIPGSMPVVTFPPSAFTMVIKLG